MITSKRFSSNRLVSTVTIFSQPALSFKICILGIIMRHENSQQCNNPRGQLIACVLLVSSILHPEETSGARNQIINSRPDARHIVACEYEV